MDYFTNFRLVESNLSQVAYQALHYGTLTASDCCEIPELHIYADVGHWKRKNQASAWIWCSNCGAFEHLDGILISEKWVNSPEIALCDLSTPPKALDKKRDIVDRHFNSFIASLNNDGGKNNGCI